MKEGCKSPSFFIMTSQDTATPNYHGVFHKEAIMAEEEKARNKKWEAGGILIPAGLFIGMGIGWALGYLVQGIFVGLGAGFLGLALVALFKRD